MVIKEVILVEIYNIFLSLSHLFVCLSLFLSPSLLFPQFVPLYHFSLLNLSISHTHKHTQHISFILATPIQAPSNTPIHCSTPSCLSFCSVLPNNPMCFVNFKRDLVLPESLRKKQPNFRKKQKTYIKAVLKPQNTHTKSVSKNSYIRAQRDRIQTGFKLV